MYIVKFNFGNSQGAFKYLVITNDCVVNLKMIKQMAKAMVSPLTKLINQQRCLSQVKVLQFAAFRDYVWGTGCGVSKSTICSDNQTISNVQLLFYSSG